MDLKFKLKTFIIFLTEKAQVQFHLIETKGKLQKKERTFIIITYV